jgi:hypothetical protein
MAQEDLVIQQSLELHLPFSSAKVLPLLLAILQPRQRLFGLLDKEIFTHSKALALFTEISGIPWVPRNSTRMPEN